MGDSAARRSEFQTAIEALIVQGWQETGPGDVPDISFMDGPQLEEAPFLVLDGLGGRTPRVEGFAGIGMRPWITVRQIRVHEDALIAGSLSFQGADESFALPISNLAPWIRTSSRVWQDVLRSRDRDNDGSDDDVGADHEDGGSERPSEARSGARPEMKRPNLEGLFEALRSSGWSVGPSAKVTLRRGPFAFDAQITELPTSANEPRRSYLLEAQLFTLPQQQKELYEGAPLPIIIFRDAISEEMRSGRSYSWATVYNGEVREFTATLEILASTLRRILPEVSRPPSRPFADDSVAHSDAAAGQPGLNFPHIARCMAQLVDGLIDDNANKKNKHDYALLTVGVFGPWGAGKSTLMEALAHQFSATGYHCFRLNPWKWDGKDPLHDFVRSTVLKQTGHAGIAWWGNLYLRFRVFRRRFGGVVWFALVLALLVWLLELSVGFAWLPDLVKEISEGKGGALFKGAVGSVALTGLTYLGKHYGAKTFDFVVSLVAGSRADHLGAEGLATAYQDVAALFDVASGGSKPFVFFVDDLDRCTPERVADFVESIHSLTAAGCVAFLACDEEYVSAALNARYEKIVKYHKDSTAFGRRFLEKVVQLPFRIPAVDESGIHELGFVTLPQRVAATPEIETPHAADAKEPSVEVKAKTSKPLPPAPPINAAQLREILGEIMSGAIESLELNVRQIKSLTNSLKLYLSIQGNLTEDQARCTAAFVFAERYDPAWLNSIYRGSEDGNTVIGRHKALAARLKSMIGDDRERMRALYRLVGRQTEASQATSQAMA